MTNHQEKAMLQMIADLHEHLKQEAKKARRKERLQKVQDWALASVLVLGLLVVIWG